MPSNRAIDSARISTGSPANECPVDAVDGVLGELLRKALVGRIIFGRDKHPGCPPVEAMNDPGPEHTANASQIATMMEQRVHQRTARMAGCGMYNDARSFVDYDEIRVLVEHDERNRLGREMHLDRRGWCRLDHFTDDKSAACTYASTTDPNVTRIDPTSNLRPRSAG